MSAAFDMGRFIASKSDQLNADDLLAGPRTIVITSVKANQDCAEQPVSIYFVGDFGKPYKPCKSMRRLMVALWGADASKYPGRSLTMFRDPTVQFGGMAVGGIRISHMSDIERDMTIALTAKRGKRTAYAVKPIPRSSGAEDPAAKWAGDHIAALDSANDADALDLLIGGASKAVEKLRANRPDLFEGVMAAYSAKRAQFAPADRTECV